MQASVSSQLTVERLIAARRLIGRDVFAGIVMLFRKTVGLSGLAALAAIAFLAARPDVRVAFIEAGNTVRYAVLGPREGAIDSAAGADTLASSDSADDIIDVPAGPVVPVAISELPRDQRAATTFLARKYRLAPDAIAALVTESYRVGNDLKVDPLLILAVMSIESNLNPFAQSAVGAQGLMQVMTPIHAERFEDYGGKQAALNPFANIRVGTAILKDLIVRNGSVEAGLKAYVGSALHPDDGGYGARVLGERARLELAIMKGGTLRADADVPVAPRPVAKTVQSSVSHDADAPAPTTLPTSIEFSVQPAHDAAPAAAEAPVKVETALGPTT
ncbi:hypothetical protein BH10PSE17_BH10PSE17_06430 [soil metagenome]